MSKAVLRKLAEIDSVCPPLHHVTDAFPILTNASVGVEHVEFFLTEIHPGGEAETDIHPISEHAYFVISGVGESYVDGEKFIINPSECLYIPPNCKHSIKPVGGQTVRFLVFMTPPRNSETIKASGEGQKPVLRKLAEIDSVCPPLHHNTDAFPILTKASVGVEHVEFFLTEIHPGGEAETDVHPISEHAYFMVSGQGEAYVDGEKFIVGPSECLYIPPGAKHSIKPIGGQTIRFVVFMAPPRQ